MLTSVYLKKMNCFLHNSNWFYWNLSWPMKKKILEFPAFFFAFGLDSSNYWFFFFRKIPSAVVQKKEECTFLSWMVLWVSPCYFQSQGGTKTLRAKPIWKFKNKSFALRFPYLWILQLLTKILERKSVFTIGSRTHDSNIRTLVMAISWCSILFPVRRTMKRDIFLGTQVNFSIRTVREKYVLNWSLWTKIW